MGAHRNGGREVAGLASNRIRWQFNLSRAPWWGGRFERIVGLVKSSLNKTIGKGCLLWTELEDILLDVEVALNNRPLSYVEDDVQPPILTPNSLMFTSLNLSQRWRPTNSKMETCASGPSS